MSTPTPWQRRFRKLAVFAGTLSSLYLLANYTLDRLRESRVRSMKDRQTKDRLRTHFTSLLSTISFTLYALFPTMLPQLSRRYPVDETRQLLQETSTVKPVSEPADRAIQSNDSAAPNAGTSDPSGSTPDESATSSMSESWSSGITSSVNDSSSTNGSDIPPTTACEGRIMIERLPIKQAIDRAAELAARIRGSQTLMDGNHRTALMSFILALAEANVLVRPTFSIYRAYLHLSQRDHPGHRDNTLNDEARLAAQTALAQYARARVRPGTPTTSYLDTCARAIRQLPIENSTVEAAWRVLSDCKLDEATRGQAYRSLDERTRTSIAQAHPKFQPVRGWRGITSKSPLPALQSINPASLVTSESGPSLSLPPLSEILENSSPEIQKVAKSSYGQQLSKKTTPLSAHLRQPLSSFDPVRWYQINLCVTSGVTPAGDPSGFSDRNYRFRENVRMFKLKHPPTKKELWADLKVHSIARAITTAYLVPLLLLLASAQLSTLARIRYLSDVKSSLSDKSKSTQQSPSEDETEAESSTVAQTRPTSGGWLKFFSVESMGLAEYVDANTPGPLSSVTNLFAGLRMNSDSKPDAREKEVVSETEEERANAERLYLTYSWWLLHQGWQGVANRVDRAVDLVFARLPIKRELSTEDWEVLLKEARAIVETEVSEEESTPTTLYDFSRHMLPPHPLTAPPFGCPLPTHPESSPYLMNLLDQTRQQLSSPDARHVLDKGISEMFRSLSGSLGYTNDESGSEPVSTKRLADCLPRLNQWGEGVWQEVPNSSVEGVLSLPDFESFVALIFGDWA